MKLSKSFGIFIQNLKRDPWANISPVVVLVLTFICLNFLLFVLAGSGIVLRFLEERAQVVMYFTDDTSEASILNLKKDIESDPRILSVDYVSKDQALATFKDWSKDDPALVESLESNPLPASLEVRAKKINDLETLSQELSKKPGVEEVKFFKDVVDKYKRVSTLLRVVSLVLLLMLSFASIVVILATVGNTIHSKGVEVEIMKLVGATEKYVKAPLILQGVFYGFVANLISIVLVYLAVIFFSPYVSSLFSGLNVHAAWWELLIWAPFMGGGATISQRIMAFIILFIIEVALGGLLGFIGATLAIKKYLKY